MADNETNTNQAAGGATDVHGNDITQPASRLRDVPGDIGEYKKFVADGGLAHNEKVQGREAAVAAAKAAGVLPEPDPAEEHKTRNRFQQRVGRLQRKIGERDAQIAELTKRVEASAATAAQNGNHAAPAPKPAAEAAPAAKPNGEAKTPARPKEEDFKTYSEFVEALADWKTDRKLEALEAKRSEDRARTEAADKGKTITDAHNARVDEAKTRYSDWDAAFKGLDDNSYTDPMVVFIFESERGPDVTYYLATHRDELAKIREMSPVRQMAALAKIEDRYADDGDGEGETEAETEKKAAKPAAKADEDDDDKPAKPAGRASKAPPPAKPLGGKAAADDAMPDPKDFAAYEAWSKRQAAKGVKR
jgi:hypothetical protein